MILEKGLILKGGAGLATAAAGGTGIYFGLDHLRNQLTIFDQGLIDFLGVDTADIQFKVMDGTSGISTNFPSFTGTSPATATVKISIKTTGTGEGTLTEKTGTKATKEELKKINGGESGEDWTWVCEIKFKKNGDSNGATELKDQNSLVNNSEPKGFFNKLKEAGNKDLKIKFIRDCAAERGTPNNREINGLKSLKTKNEKSIKTANQIDSEKLFELKKGDDNKLHFENEGEFKKWFSK